MARKICVVITARASYSRIRSLLIAINNNKNLRLQTVVTASAVLNRHGSILEEIRDDDISITATLHNVLEGETLLTSAKTTGLGVIELSSLFNNLKPDIVITIADRYETMSTAISASYMNIPLAHIQGGEVTGNIDEKVRHSITKLADIHLVANEDAAERVKKLGEEENTIFITGCPSIDIAAEVLNKDIENFNIYEKYSGSGDPLDLSRGYIIAMQHFAKLQLRNAQNCSLQQCNNAKA